MRDEASLRFPVVQVSTPSENGADSVSESETKRADPPTSEGKRAARVAAPPRAATAESRRRIRDASFLLLVVALMGLVAYLSPIRILEALTSRTALLIYMVMVAEYLFIKSTDRTRIYRLENHRLRDRRRETEELLRDVDTALDNASTLPMPDNSGTHEWKRRVQELRDRIKKML